MALLQNPNSLYCSSCIKSLPSAPGGNAIFHRHFIHHWPFIEKLLIFDNEENAFALLIAVSQVQEDMSIGFSNESASGTTALIRVTT